MTNGVPFRDRALPVEVSSAINTCIQFIDLTASPNSIDVMIIEAYYTGSRAQIT